MDLGSAGAAAAPNVDSDIDAMQVLSYTQDLLGVDHAIDRHSPVTGEEEIANGGITEGGKGDEDGAEEEKSKTPVDPVESLDAMLSDPVKDAYGSLLYKYSPVQKVPLGSSEESDAPSYFIDQSTYVTLCDDAFRSKLHCLHWLAMRMCISPSAFADPESVDLEYSAVVEGLKKLLARRKEDMLKLCVDVHKNGRVAWHSLVSTSLLLSDFCKFSTCEFGASTEKEEKKWKLYLQTMDCILRVHSDAASLSRMGESTSTVTVNLLVGTMSVAWNCRVKQDMLESFEKCSTEFDAFIDDRKRKEKFSDVDKDDDIEYMDHKTLEAVYGHELTDTFAKRLRTIMAYIFILDPKQRNFEEAKNGHLDRQEDNLWKNPQALYGLAFLQRSKNALRYEDVTQRLKELSERELAHRSVDKIFAGGMECINNRASVLCTGSWDKIKTEDHSGDSGWYQSSPLHYLNHFLDHRKAEMELTLTQKEVKGIKVRCFVIARIVLLKRFLMLVDREFVWLNNRLSPVLRRLAENYNSSVQAMRSGKGLIGGIGSGLKPISIPVGYERHSDMLVPYNVFILPDRVKKLPSRKYEEVQLPVMKTDEEKNRSSKAVGKSIVRTAEDVAYEKGVRKFLEARSGMVGAVMLDRCLLEHFGSNRNVPLIMDVFKRFVYDDGIAYPDVKSSSTYLNPQMVVDPRMLDQEDELGYDSDDAAKKGKNGDKKKDSGNVTDKEDGRTPEKEKVREDGGDPVLGTAEGKRKAQEPAAQKDLFFEFVRGPNDNKFSYRSMFGPPLYLNKNSSHAVDTVRRLVPLIKAMKKDAEASVSVADTLVEAHPIPVASRNTKGMRERMRNVCMNLEKDCHLRNEFNVDQAPDETATDFMCRNPDAMYSAYNEYAACGGAMNMCMKDKKNCIFASMSGLRTAEVDLVSSSSITAQYEASSSSQPSQKKSHKQSASPAKAGTTDMLSDKNLLATLLNRGNAGKSNKKAAPPPAKADNITDNKNKVQSFAEEALKREVVGKQWFRDALVKMIYILDGDIISNELKNDVPDKHTAEEEDFTEIKDVYECSTLDPWSNLETLLEGAGSQIQHINDNDSERFWELVCKNAHENIPSIDTTESVAKRNRDSRNAKKAFESDGVERAAAMGLAPNKAWTVVGTGKGAVAKVFVRLRHTVHACQEFIDLVSKGDNKLKMPGGMRSYTENLIDDTIRNSDYACAANVGGGACARVIMESQGMPAITRAQCFFTLHGMSSKPSCFDVARDDPAMPELLQKKFPRYRGAAAKGGGGEEEPSEIILKNFKEDRMLLFNYADRCVAQDNSFDVDTALAAAIVKNAAADAKDAVSEQEAAKIVAEKAKELLDKAKEILVAVNNDMEDPGPKSSESKSSDEKKANERHDMETDELEEAKKALAAAEANAKKADEEYSKAVEAASEANAAYLKVLAEYSAQAIAADTNKGSASKTPKDEKKAANSTALYADEDARDAFLHRRVKDLCSFMGERDLLEICTAYDNLSDLEHYHLNLSQAVADCMCMLLDVTDCLTFLLDKFGCGRWPEHLCNGAYGPTQENAQMSGIEMDTVDLVRTELLARNSELMIENDEYRIQLFKDAFNGISVRNPLLQRYYVKYNDWQKSAIKKEYSEKSSRKLEEIAHKLEGFEVPFCKEDYISDVTNIRKVLAMALCQKSPIEDVKVQEWSRKRKVDKAGNVQQERGSNGRGKNKNEMEWVLETKTKKLPVDGEANVRFFDHLLQLSFLVFFTFLSCSYFQIALFLTRA